MPESIEVVGHLHSRKSNRLLTKQRQFRARDGADDVRKASIFKRYEKRPADGRNMTCNRDINAGRHIHYKG